jgi:hypothetical protein
MLVGVVCMFRYPKEAFCAGTVHSVLHWIWVTVLYVVHTAGHFTSWVMTVVIGTWVSSAVSLRSAFSNSATAVFHTICVVCVSFARSVAEVVFNAETQRRVLLFVLVSAMVGAVWLLRRLRMPADEEVRAFVRAWCCVCVLSW